MSASAYKIEVSTWFKFLFIGWGQVDTWQPLIDILEPFRFTNMEFSIKITISYELGSFFTRIIIFLWSCKFAWLCEISYVLVKSTQTFFLAYNTIFLIWLNLHSYANLQFMVFELLFNSIHIFCHSMYQNLTLKWLQTS